MHRLRFVQLIALLALLVTPAHSDTVRHAVAPGVTFEQEMTSPPDGPLVINILRINLKTPGVKVESALARDVVLTDDKTRGREAVGELALRRGAVAAINADFFPFTGDPLGVAIRNGELLSEPMPYRAAMALTPDGQALFDTLLSVGMVMGEDGVVGALDGINRLPGKDEVVALTPSFGDKLRASARTTAVTLSGVSLPVKLGQDYTGVASAASTSDPRVPIPADGVVLVGDGRGAEWLRLHITAGGQARFRFDLVSNPLPSGPRRPLPSRAGALRGKIAKGVWSEATQAVSGGPWLVRGGNVLVDGAEEGFPDQDFTLSRHPRTVAGVTSSGELLLVTVDGRQSFSKGLSLPDMARLMLRLGAVNAINLDGGGSTSMVVNGLYVNGPSDGEPRPVANALLVFAEGSTDPVADIQGDPITLRAGDSTTLVPPGTAEAPSVQRATGSKQLWGTVEGTGFVSQGGRFQSTHAGTASVFMLKDGQRTRIPIQVVPAAPSKLKVVLQAAANNPPDRNQIVIVLSDTYGNGTSGQSVRLQVTGGVAEKVEVVTDERGRAVLEVVWDVEKGRKVVVTSGALSASATK